MNRPPKEDAAKESEAFRQARFEAKGEIFKRMWYWQGMCIKGAETAADVSHLLDAPFFDVALAYVRSIIE